MDHEDLVTYTNTKAHEHTRPLPSQKGSDHPVEHLHGPDAAEDDKPLPEGRGMEEQEDVEEDVVEVGEVKDPEGSAPPHEVHAAGDHGGEDEEEGHARGVGPAWHCAE